MSSHFGTSIARGSLLAVRDSCLFASRRIRRMASDKDRQASPPRHWRRQLAAAEAAQTARQREYEEAEQKTRQRPKLLREHDGRGRGSFRQSC